MAITTNFLLKQLLIAFLFIICFTCLCHLLNQYNEPFSNIWNINNKGPMAPDCYNLSPDSCLNYSNCGLCINTTHKLSKCVPGDEQGALFESGCDKWKYTNFYDRDYMGKCYKSTTPSFDKFYPSDYELSYVSPVSRSAL